MKKIALSFVLGVCSLVVFAQELTQNIKGKIIDEDSKTPAIGATVVIVGSDPIVGTTTDLDGNFILQNVPIGKVSLLVTYVGYEPKPLNNLSLTSGKELYLEIPIVENIQQLKAVEIKAYADKTEAINEMALLSSNTVTVEETKRYAGSFNDPARMVSSYAGVSSNPSGDNDIVVRGNSPKGILWRLEGVEIPNPNHFADEGSTGGPINALNSSMLANSDFYTGAFAPEYGNALSGVFDIKLRKGNSDKREYMLGMGVIGMEAAVEGPFKKGGKSSYLANYRYSTLGVLDNAGIVDFGGVPKYQDGSFNLNFPTEKLGTFTAFGLGGLSKIADEDYYVDGEDTTYYRGTYGANVGVAGVTNTYLINNKSYVKTIVSASTNGSNYEDEEGDSFTTLEKSDMDDYTKTTYRATTSYNAKITSRTRINTGIVFSSMNFNFFSEYIDDEGNMFRPLEEKGVANYGQAYTSVKHRFTENLTAVGGLHYLHFFFNDSYSIEPRLAVKWKVSELQNITLGYGKHSKTESLFTYTAKFKNSEGNEIQPNREIQLPKAHHFVAGYGIQLAENTRIKAEVYYQHLYDVPVEEVDTSNISLINESSWYVRKELENTGLGRNYGLELTLERFFANNFYYLFTTSLYQSEYKANDGSWHNTKYNGNYNINFLFGKEFQVRNDNVITFNIKSSLLGANRYAPIDLEASRTAQRTRRDNTKPFEEKGDDVFFINVSGGYRINRPSATHEIKFEVLNATNNQAALNKYYNPTTDKIETSSTQLPLIPNIIYTVNF